MNIKGIDKVKCTVCLACMKDCPPRLFSRELSNGKKQKVIFSDPTDNCIHCGHCVSVCPHDAILYKAQGEASVFPGIEDLSSIISYKDMLAFLQAKRSVRQYKQTPLAAEDIDAVLTAMQYAPSGTNARAWEYVVITNPEVRKSLGDAVIRLMKGVRILFRLKWLVYFFLPGYLKKYVVKPGILDYMEKFFLDYENGYDRLFFKAPAVIILHSPPYGHLAGNDAGIALTYGMLAAQARGIGSCWIGFAQEAFYVRPSLKKKFNIPRHHEVHGVVVMGYPEVTYGKVPPRDPLNIQFIGE